MTIISKDSRLPWCVTTPVRRPADPDVLQSVGTALDVLDCFAMDHRLGVSELAERLGVAKSTAHRMLSTLASRGFIEQAGDGRYELGLHLHELGQLAQARYQLRRKAMGTLRQLSRQTGLSVMLCVADGPDVVDVDRVETPDLLEDLAHLGARFPSHCTSAGKVLAAYDPAVAQARRDAGYVPRNVPGPRTDNEWDRALAKVRRDGYAASVGELVDTLASLAVPLFDPQRRIVGAIVLLEFATEGALLRRLPAAIAAARRIGMADRPRRQTRPV